MNVLLKTSQVISGTGFYGSNDPTNSVKALKSYTHRQRKMQNYDNFSLSLTNNKTVSD